MLFFALSVGSAMGGNGSLIGASANMVMVGIAERVVAAEIASAQGDRDVGIRALEEAVKIEQRIPYDEPPGWILPVRHSLGATLMQVKRFAEAEAVYREDLKHRPENGWSLFGLAQSLEKQGKTDEAAPVRERFDRAWAKADLKITSSCLCQPGV